MKKTINAIALFLLIGMAFTSCKKEKTAFPEENPLNAYLANSGFNEKTVNFINSGYYEFGYKFIPKVTGKINAVTFKIPDNATDTRVTIWDNVSKTVLKTIVIPTNTANVEVRTNIEPVALVANKEYLITYNGNDWYKRSKTSNADATYPITAGNIDITGYQWDGGTTQSYPLDSDVKYYGGDLSIVFQQTE